MAIQSDVSVFLVDDSQPVRERLKELLALHGGARIVGESATAGSAIHGIPITKPDFVVLDYQLLDGTGLDVLRKVREAVPLTRFIVLTNHAGSELRDAFAQAGAWCLLDKSYEFDRLAGLIATRQTAVDRPPVAEEK